MCAGAAGVEKSIPQETGGSGTGGARGEVSVNCRMSHSAGDILAQQQAAAVINRSSHGWVGGCGNAWLALNG